MSVRNFLFSGACVGRAQSFGLLILRLVFGATMFRIGLDKVRNYEAMTGMWADPTGFMGDTPSLWLLIFAEFVCSALVAIGFLTRFAAIPLVIAMAVAAFVAHANDPWVASEAGQAAKTLPLLFLGGFAGLLFTGAGRYSVDGALSKREG